MNISCREVTNSTNKRSYIKVAPNFRRLDRKKVKAHAQE